MIGAAAVSERAFGLETAAKERNLPVLLAEHSSFLADYRALVEGLREMIG